MLPDLLVFGEPAGFQFRKDLLAVDAHFKAAAIRWNQDEAFDSCLQFGDEFVGQTDRLLLVVSSLAVNDFDFHYLPCLIPSLMPSHTFFN